MKQMRLVASLALALAANASAFDREETLQWFREHQFGTTPVGRPSDEVFGERSVSFFGGKIKIDITCVLPDDADAARPVPVFLFGDHVCGKAPDFKPGDYDGIPTNAIVSRGYAYVRWNFNDVAPNAARYSGDLWRWPQGVIAYLATGDRNATNVVRRATSWGTLGAWAWGHSRVMDWIETRPELDASRVAVVGHSRGGKTALWAGAQDTRFAMVVSNGSGCGGAKLSRLGLEKAENFRQILYNFPNWFCPAFTEWVDRDIEITHDADDLMRLVAPRLLYVASATEDKWAGPHAEKAAWDSAHDVWQAAGLEANMGYHIHEGGHKLRADDWERFMDFADSRMARRTEREPSVAERTARWQAEIDAAEARGGGTVVVPAGRHLVGELELKSNVRLHLERNAVLEGAVGIENYRNRMLPYSEGTWSAVVSAIGATNVSVTGEGEIFGNGAAWNPKRGALDAMGCKEGLRPRGLFFADCRGVNLENFVLRDAACWGVVFKRCDGVAARGIKIDSCANRNNDGFDIEAKNAVIEDCDVNCGDDALCIKSNDPGYVVENVVVRGTVARTHCNAIKIGTATHGTVRNIRFENILVEAPRRVYRDYAPMPEDLLNAPEVDGAPDYLAGAGICAIAIECVDGGTVEDITVDGVEMSGCKVPIFVRGGSRTNRACAIPPGKAHVLRRIAVRNVRGRAESRIPSSITGVAGCRPSDILLQNIKIECVGEDSDDREISEPNSSMDGKYPEATMFGHLRLPVYGLYVAYADGVTFDNVVFSLRRGTTDVRKPW